MRLINTTTLGIEIFFDDHAPPYAILSHRWHDGEVSLQEMESGTAIERPGYAKIVQTCALASRDGLGYAWVDTCCIDKTSSAELSVAINSMYRWYREAVVCYAFLSDVEFDDVGADAGAEAFSSSAWFSRGWTLQELLAPAKVEFYNVSWHKIGTKATLGAAIEARTGIDLAVLKGARLSVFSIARRMSWAAGRKTTVPEDTAYCLFGLFGVNMPMLYGEGEKAFIRLQEEIMKNSEDQSLFAWTSKEPYAQGLLARSPDDFAACGDIVMVRKRWNRIPYSVTNLGLSIQLPMMPWAMDTYLVTLDCRNEDEPDSRVAIFLRLLSRPNQLLRVPFEEGDRSVFKDEMVEKLTYRDVFVHQPPPGVIMIPPPLYGFYLRNFSAPILTVRTTTDSEIPLSKVWSQCDWDDEKRLLELPVGESGTVGMISWNRQDGNGWFMKFGFDFEFNPVLQLGGDMVSPNRPLTMDPNSVEAWMNPTWMDGPAHSKYLHKADRMIGLEEEVFIASMRISIMLEEIDDTGKRAWIVDIADHKSKYPRHADLCEGYVNEGISVRKLPKSS
ncbi:hypothetical protein V495_00704 [Pseudogymnoascus sp. VKM F-4514 (FW-929)]|nr:hypothetical protein V495_00704 [Pseudogymnoascus sp. VKM F-4514 (FW-929)]KFY65777.1 hypothetical protein V497_01281 [Pseudogymnoascus sp. VKM F-4516 (FW-969)]